MHYINVNVCVSSQVTNIEEFRMHSIFGFVSFSVRILSIRTIGSFAQLTYCIRELTTGQIFCVHPVM